ncbi:PREDICTED: probable ATP-dependent RNA helicase DDX60-like [Elephantulus edwardii]|uniref:probable ATP-dependent RNA helicase DDX60-like n=1 Tax=Elephantulus edwardii TaxID=28737 RepID=UPI0003F07E54|nr:PREDICTED: probable ATP-dependent RNA helicase DDX60-like [Elephantulus edwardii]
MKILTQFVSLLKDFVESEFFLIDGDSLFLTCISNVNLKRGQTLHFFYLVEQFLHDFLQKEARFVIVFFKDVENMYFNYPDLLALRTTLIQHLKHNTGVTVHTEFSNCFSPEWEIFLKECYPYFLIVSEKGIIPHHTDFLNIFIIHALQKKINIVLSGGQETDVLRIYGYYAPSLYSHKEFFQKHENKLQHILHDYLRNYFHKLQKKEILLYGHMRLDLEDMQKELKRCEFFTLKQLEVNNWKLNFTGLPDLSDMILWRNIAYYYENEYITVSNQEIHKSGLIPLKSDIIEDYAGDILAELPFLSSNDPIVISLKKREFDELTHWHSSRPLSGDFERARCTSDVKANDAKARRNIQKLHYFYRVLGKSLVGSNRSIIVVREMPLKSPANSSAQKKGKCQKNKTEKIIEENKKRQQDKLERREEERWNNLSLCIEKEIKENPNSGMKRLEDFLETCPVKSVKLTVEMEGLEACFKSWMKYCLKPEVKSKDLSIIILMMKRIHIIHDKYTELLQNIHRQKLAKYLKYIGFDNLAHLLCPQESRTDKDISKYSVNMGAARFQLMHMGPYLFREERSDPDPRVQHFIPDTWQRELLDVVDNNESAVIVAPTSSGKTYASYYCMEKILRESDEGVVVYVAPTKALVNQVVGTICSLFNKSLPNGVVLCGVFTRDYRHDALNCQILVTVPQCLEILLLSPHRQNWVKRIRYVIFDEVHCLGGEIGAEVWEHLLVMIRCPFLALSATISNPEDLTEWLKQIKRYWQDVESAMENSNSSSNASKVLKKQKDKSIQKSSYCVRLVLYKERYNDLEKYVCSIKDNDFVIEHYHPCGALTVSHIKKYGIPSDLGFSPRESILLYDAMVHVWPEWSRMKELEPEEFSLFKNKIVIKKADTKIYEEELKKELIQWIQLDPDKLSVSHPGFSLSSSCPVTPTQVSSCSGLYPSRVLGPMGSEKSKSNSHHPTCLCLVCSVHKSSDTFPLACSLLGSRYGPRELILGSSPRSSVVTRKIQSGSCWPFSCHSSSSPTAAQLVASGARVQRLILEVAEMQELKKHLKKLTQVPSDCTYTDRARVDYKTFRKILYRIRDTRQCYKLRNLLWRGIGYHHGSMEHKQRQVVEMLFRVGHAKVVTATSTLALGINMPCKSVVFTEDSVYLDALHFRQMSGRAGRRGEDPVGNVFFYDIPLPKIERLLKSNVPKLKGQFPLSISLVLRLMLLVSKADDKEDAKAKALSVLKHSLMSFNQPRIMCMLKFFFIYSLQFLVREGYLDQECNPIGYTGLVTHLHYHEPANFVLVSFLVKGLFHKLCIPMKRKGPKKFSEEVMETLVVVLAHLFGRRYLPPCVKKFEKAFSHSVVILKDLPKDFATVIEEHNNRVHRNFGSFLLTISKLADMRKEYQLPLSEIDFSDKKCEESQLVTHLMPGLESRTAVSPFACLSNITDQDLFDINVVDDAMLRTISVNVKDIPFLQLNKYDKNGRKCPLNGYALNFYKHGSLSLLTLDNWLNMGDAFNLIRDFFLVIQSIRISLRELCDNENDNVVLAFKQLSEEFRKKFYKNGKY